METRKFEVPAMHCGHCVRTIQNEVSQIPGVQQVDADVASRAVTIKLDEPATWEQVRDRLDEIGYSAR